MIRMKTDFVFKIRMRFEEERDLSHKYVFYNSGGFKKKLNELLKKNGLKCDIEELVDIRSSDIVPSLEDMKKGETDPWKCREYFTCGNIPLTKRGVYHWKNEEQGIKGEEYPIVICKYGNEEFKFEYFDIANWCLWFYIGKENVKKIEFPLKLEDFKFKLSIDRTNLK